MRSRMDGSVNSEIQVFDTAYRWRQCVAAEKFPLCVLMLFCRILLSNDEFFIIVARHSYTSCTFLSFTPLQQFLLCHCVSLSVPVSISPFFCHTIHCSFQHRMFNVSSICFRTYFFEDLEYSEYSLENWTPPQMSRLGFCSSVLKGPNWFLSRQKMFTWRDNNKVFSNSRAVLSYICFLSFLRHPVLSSPLPLFPTLLINSLSFWANIQSYKPGKSSNTTDRGY